MEIKAGKDYPVRIGHRLAVVRVQRVDGDPTFGTILTYQLVGKSGATYGAKRSWPLAWFHDFWMSNAAVGITTQAERLLTELDRDHLAEWWRSLQDCPAVPPWIVQDEQGHTYQG